MALYKFCRAEHMESVLTDGSLKVGTLHNYADPSKFGTMVADATEGAKVINAHLIEVTPDILKRHVGLKGIISADPDFHGQFMGYYDITIASTNLMIFSTALHYDAGVHQVWKAKEGYDACYEIVTPSKFFVAIDKSLGADFKFLGLRPVLYQRTFDAKDSKSTIPLRLPKSRIRISSCSRKSEPPGNL